MQTLKNIKIVANNLKSQFDVTVELGKYAPGDGWTRYSVSVNGWHDIRNSMTARECEIYLSGLYDMLRVQADENRTARLRA
jgi:hypothetical protein